MFNNNSKTTGNISGSTFGDNINFQGDHVKQTKITFDTQEKDSAFRELFALISSLEDQDKKEQAQYNAEELKEAVEDGNTSKAQKLCGFLQKTLGNASALLAIGQFVGWLPPNPIG